MPNSHIHFAVNEFEHRQQRVREELVDRGLDGMLLFKIEDMYWLCGLDTDGFCIFHNMFIGVNGELTHVSRSADLASINYSSICEDVRIWVDSPNNPPVNTIRDMLESHGMRGKRIGVQYDTFGLTAKMYKQLEAVLDGLCELVDVSDLIRLLRVVKSPQELVYLRKAGEICDAVMEKGIELTASGAYEGDILAEMHGLIWKMDGDPPAHRWPMGAGGKALMGRYATGRQHIGDNDQVTYEIGNGYRHYHAASMAVVLTGPKVDPRHQEMHEACAEALEAIQGAMRPGNTVGDMFRAHADAFTRRGLGHAVLNACGYTMGATWPPTWMEHPMIIKDNPLVLEPNMTFFTHMILVDNSSGLSMALGEQAIIHEDKLEVITHVPRNLLVN